jgi:hypothetical protein
VKKADSDRKLLGIDGVENVGVEKDGVSREKAVGMETAVSRMLFYKALEELEKGLPDRALRPRREKPTRKFIPLRGVTSASGLYPENRIPGCNTSRR